MSAGALEEAVKKAILSVLDRFELKEIVTGTVTKVGETSCDVERDNAPALYDVRLSAIDDDLQTYCVTVPAVGSVVVVGIIEGMKTEAILLRCSEVKEFRIKIGGKTFVFDTDGVTLNGTNLAQWMNKVHADMSTIQNLLKVSPIAGNGSAAAIVFTPQTTSVQ